MSTFTAQDARNIIKEDSFVERGQIIDLIRTAAKQDNRTISLDNINVKSKDKEFFLEGGFILDTKTNTIAW